MNATAHPFTPEEIMAFLDGELPADRAQSISAHTESCASCHGVMQEIQRTKNAFSSWPVPTLPSTAENRIQTALGKSASLRPIPAFAISRRFNSWSMKQWILALALTSGAAILFLGIAIPNLLRSRMAANEAAAVYRQQQGLQARVPVDDSVNQKARMRFDKDKTVAPITDQQGKVFSYEIPFAEATPSVAKDSNGLSHSNEDIAGHSVSVDDGEDKDQQSVSFAQPMIARTVSLAVVTKDFDASHKSLEAILARHNGYAASLSVSTPQGAAKSIDASLRVPAPQLAAALTELRALGRVENEGQNGEEVTQEHADLVARLKNSRETEQRLQAILAQRTGKIKDVLAVEQEIDRVRGEIEQMEAEQKNLEHRVDFATIDLKLSEEYKAQLNSPAPSVSTLLRNASINGLRTAADSVLSLILFFSESGPVVLLWLAILAIPAWQLWRRYRRAAAAI